ncbi:type VI secretion system lipoprotein TssJ [Zooshikella sp. RANM57]|uniref:type VI secretion system lipoprotein TssJ n=1 Tax=Zooshikella sp. RANM57 TaxID=3425863 RepID=UPI003D6FF02F
MNKWLARWQYNLLFGLLCCVALITTGCFKSETKLDLEVVVAPDANPDHSGRPSPVVVKLYELNSPVVFENADFFALYSDPVKVLGASLLGQEEHEFVPGSTSELNLLLNPSTQFVAFLAAYRDIENANWRLVVKVEPLSSNEFSLRINRLSLSK